MKNQHTPGIRYSLKEGWYVSQVDGKDLPVTTFCETRAWVIARAAIAKAQSVNMREYASAYTSGAPIQRVRHG